MQDVHIYRSIFRPWWQWPERERDRARHERGKIVGHFSKEEQEDPEGRKEGEGGAGKRERDDVEKEQIKWKGIVRVVEEEKSWWPWVITQEKHLEKRKETLIILKKLFSCPPQQKKKKGRRRGKQLHYVPLRTRKNSPSHSCKLTDCTQLDFLLDNSGKDIQCWVRNKISNAPLTSQFCNYFRLFIQNIYIQLQLSYPNTDTIYSKKKAKENSHSFVVIWWRRLSEQYDWKEKREQVYMYTLQLTMHT